MGDFEADLLQPHDDTGLTDLVIKLKQVRADGTQTELTQLKASSDALVREAWSTLTRTGYGTPIPHGTPLDEHDVILILSVRNAIVDNPLRLTPHEARALLEQHFRLPPDKWDDNLTAPDLDD